MDLKINERWVSVTTWINGKMGGKIKSAQNRWEEKIAVSFFPFSLIVKNFLSASGGKKNGRWVGGTPSDALFPQGWCRRIREESSIAFLIPLPGNSGSTGSVTGNTGEHVVLSAPLKIRCKTSEEGEWLSSPSAEIRLYNRLWCSAPWSDKQFWVQQLKSKKKKKATELSQLQNFVPGWRETALHKVSTWRWEQAENVGTGLWRGREPFMRTQTGKMMMLGQTPSWIWRDQTSGTSFVDVRAFQ